MNWKNMSHIFSPLPITFLGLIAVSCVIFFASPKSSFSENEKRALQDAPALNFESLKDGTFASQTESYLSDHFPARLQLVGLNAYFNLICGQNGANGIYAGKDGYLFNVPLAVDAADTVDTVDTAEFRQNLGAIASFAKRHKMPAYMMAVPAAGYIATGKLPQVHAPYQDGALLRQAKEATEGTKWIDVAGALKIKSGEEQLYYRTDHHWTSAGAYTAYRAFCARRGFSPLPQSDFAVKNVAGFYGTTYSKSGLWATAPDVLSVWTDPSLHVKVTISDDGNPASVKSDSMFFWNQLVHEDKYPVFLDGNHSLVTIENPSASDRSLLIVKDSYADCLAPFLAEHYRRISMVDLRYFHKDTVSALLKRDKADEVLFLYGLDSLVNDRNLSLLE